MFAAPDVTTGSASNPTVDSVRLTLNVNTGSATKFNITFTPADTNGDTGIPDVSASVLPATVTLGNLTSGTSYTVTVTAYCDDVPSTSPAVFTAAPCERPFFLPTDPQISDQIMFKTR